MRPSWNSRCESARRSAARQGKIARQLNDGVMSKIKRFVKDLAFRSPLARWLSPRYHYSFRPADLAFLTQTLTEVHEVKGSVLEVGCFAGATTIFLSEHLRDLGAPRRYVCIDTFDGFVSADVAHETQNRKKEGDRATFETGFAMNRRSWVTRSLTLGGHKDVELLEADAGAVDYTSYGPVALR